MVDYHEKFIPGEDIVIIIDDKTADDRTKEQINEMFIKIREIINSYGFDLHTWGKNKGIYDHYKRLEQLGFFEKDSEDPEGFNGVY